MLGRLRDLRGQILNDPLTPRRVAAGWALGMFVGCAIPFGFQLIVSVPLAVLTRVSKIGATLGTLVTNPVTIWFIYPLQTWAIDHLFFGGSLSIDALMNMTWTWENVRMLGMHATLSFIIGGLVLAAILTPITYWLVLGIVSQKDRRK